MKIEFLGTNGWYDSKTGNTLCILIKSREFNIVLDAGSGFSKIDTCYNPDKPVYLLLSHFHLDHIIGLHTLAKCNFKKGLHIVGQAGMEKLLRNIINHPYTVPFENLAFKTTFIEQRDDSFKLPFDVLALPLEHSDTCLGYRIEVDGKTIAFCTDTGYCENAIILAKNADVLIAECAARAGEYNSQWPHLDPETAARIAAEAKAKLLVLAHFDAKKYKTGKERKEAGNIAKNLFVNSLPSEDGMVINI